MTIGSQMPELDREAFLPPYKIGSQNTPYKLGLKIFLLYILTDSVFTQLGGLSDFFVKPMFCKQLLWKIIRKYSAFAEKYPWK